MSKELIIGKELPVLDKGFVRVVDVMGDDQAIVDAARVSYASGTKHVSTNNGLIRYLFKHRHTSPFEMCELKLHLKLPMMVVWQLIRHRTANVNGMSGRYSIMKDEMYFPDIEFLGSQSKDNKQGRALDLSPEEAKEALDLIRATCDDAYVAYGQLINETIDGKVIDDSKSGIARELSRMVLPFNMYTEFYWKMDLHNLLHFLKLRMDSHAQHEIRMYANVIAEIVKQWVPVTYKAFENYSLNAVTLSEDEIKLVKYLLEGIKIPNPLGFDLSDRELLEFKERFGV